MKSTVVCLSFVLTCLTFTNVVVQAKDKLPLPKFSPLPEAQYELSGIVGEYVDAVTHNWILKMPDANPAVLEMFRDRDKKPYRRLLPWSGAFAGKYLIGAVQVHRLTQNPVLKDYIAKFVSKLVLFQAEDGYLGPFPPDNRLEGKPCWDNFGTWDVWGHYHIMVGLLLWYEDTGDKNARHCVEKIGDLLCRKFLNTGKRIVDTGSAEMNHAAIHSLGRLYQLTRKRAYLDLACQIIEEFQDQRAGDYVLLGLSGKEFYQSRKPRWESLHAIQGIAEMYWLTG